MLFHSFPFVVFLMVTLLLTRAVRGRVRAQVRVLLVASYVFYMWWNPAFISLIVLSTAVDFVAGRAIAQSPDKRNRRRWLLLSLLVNLGGLAVFKYLDFALQTIAYLFGVAIDPVGLTLPVGISFYTFQTLSYTISIYRNEIEPTDDPERFALFVSLFPQLVAGPIVRARQLLPRLAEPLRITGDGFSRGMPVFYGGLLKKIIADNLSPFVDGVYGQLPDARPGAIVWATILFSLQIYCDFSGYTDMAIGVARLSGIELPINFDGPYLARSMRDFWRRWHISLSTWLRDYLYIPLGGSRRGPWRTHVNLMITMLLGGLWHGASWNFVLWGGYHGLLLAVTNALRGRPIARLGSVPAIRPLQHAVTLLFILFGWALFRARTAEQLEAVLSAFASPAEWGALSSRAALPDGFTLSVAGGFLAVHLASRAVGGIGERLGSAHWVVASAASTAALLSVWLLWPSNPEPFVYFQF